MRRKLIITLVFVVPICALVFGIWGFRSYMKQNNLSLQSPFRSIFVSEQEKKVEIVNEKEKTQPSEENKKQNKEQNNATEKQSRPKLPSTLFTNHKYGYTMDIPNAWHTDNSLADKELEPVDMEDENVKLLSGGIVLWSNYENIDQYTPETRPEDMFILAGTVYEDTQSGNLDTFAQNIGFNAALTEKKPFLTESGLEGTRFISDGLNEKNPRIAIVFQKGNRFYVFNIAFINDNMEVYETMAGVVRTFKWL